MKNQTLTQLPLRPSSLSRLLRSGFETTDDVLSAVNEGSFGSFASELGTTSSDASRIWKEVKSFVNLEDDQYGNDHATSEVVSSKVETAASLLQKSIQGRDHSSRPIVSFCKSIDSLLGGGVCQSEVTEIVGEPGVGKTQLAMQLCVDVSLPLDHGGVAGEAIYIDSEGSFSPERALSLSEGLVTHVHASARRRKERRGSKTHHLVPTVPDWFEKENLLNRIHVFRVYDEASQKATLLSLPNFIEAKEKGSRVKLIVLDSIAFHYRSQNANQSNDYLSRTQSIVAISSILSEIATKYEIAVVVINQMTTKFRKNASSISDSNLNADSRLTPALGETWAHCTTTRLILSKLSLTSKVRKCTLVKSPHKPAGTAHFVITEVGIRDTNRQSDVSRNVDDISKKSRVLH